MSNENSIDIKMLSHTCVFELKKTLDLFSADEQIWKELNHIHVLGLSLDFKELLSKVDEQFKNLGMNLFVNFENLSAERNDGVEYAKLSIFISSMIIAYIQENKIDANYLVNDLIMKYFFTARLINYNFQRVNFSLNFDSRLNSERGKKKGDKNKEKIIEFYNDIKKFREKNKFMAKDKCAAYLKDNENIPLSEKKILEVINKIDKEISNLR